MSNVTTVSTMKTERDWLNAIETESKFPVQVVEETLRRYGVRAQSTPPRAKKVLFRSLSFTGTKVGTQLDGPFAFEWDGLATGLWAVMSDDNSRGKSSIMNMLYAALRGDFPGNIKPDVWKWLSRLDVVIRIDVVDYKIHIEKDSGVEDVAQARAQLLRWADDNWIDLYVGAVGVGLKEQTESLFMDELGFAKIHASNRQGGQHTHGWPTVAAALSIGGHSEGKALFGDILMDGLPLRLLQMFIVYRDALGIHAYRSHHRSENA